MDAVTEATSSLSLAASDAAPTLEVNGVSICFVDSVAGVQAAVASVCGAAGSGSGVSVVALDLEGVDLGPAGRISTLQMCVADASHPERGVRLSERQSNTTTVFEVDIASLGAAAFAAEAGLRSLLESDVTKLLWDVRSDAAALFHQYGVRLNPDSTIDLQLLAVIKGENMVGLPSLGSVFDAPDSVLSFTEKKQMKALRDEARKLYLPQCGGSFDAWLARPLSPVLQEYAADVRFFGRLRASLSKVEEQYSLSVKAAVQKRIAEAQAPAYTNEDHGSAVDMDFWSGVIDAAPELLKPRLQSARLNAERDMRLPLDQRIKKRGMVKSAMLEALGLLSGRRSDSSVSNFSLWAACSHVAAHDRWFDTTEWKEFMSAAASCALLSAKQRGTMARWLAHGGIPHHDDSDDDYYSDGDY